MTANTAPRHEDVVVDSIRVSSRNGEALRGLLVSPVRETVTRDGRLHIAKDTHGTEVRWTDDDKPATFRAMSVALQRRRTSQDDRTLLGTLKSLGAHGFELHLARDTTGSFSHGHLTEAYREDRIVSMREQIYIESKSSPDPTIYVGKPTSAVQIRTYDRTEVLRKKRGLENAEQLTRFEIVARRQMADYLLEQLVAVPEQTDPATGEVRWPILPVFNALFGEAFYVLQSKDDPHRGDRARASLDPLYQEFINIRETNIAFPFVRERPDDEDFEKKVEWVLSAAGGVHMIRNILGVQGMEAYMALGAAKPYRHPLLETDRDRAATLLMQYLGMKPSAEKGGSDV